jgi:hypothetical protein
MKKTLCIVIISSLYLSLFSQLTVDPSNNIGMGTTTPENSEGWNKVLDVYGANHSKILVTTNSIQTGMWSHNLGALGAGAGGIIGTHSNHPFSIITNSAARISILTSGNVGVGTAIPRSLLDIWKGDLMVTGTDLNGTAYVTSKGGTAFFSNNTYSNGIAIASNGSVGVGTSTPATTYALQVYGTSTKSGLYSSAKIYNNYSVYGIVGAVDNSSGTLAIGRGIYGVVYNSTPIQSGQAYGVIGTAGNSTNGYNIGVLGQLLGSNNGAGIYGSVDYFSTAPDAKYAGYFAGNVKITGSIWAMSGTITGSDERIKKDISGLDSSDNILKLNAKKYKLKSRKELQSLNKMPSDTAKITIDNIPETENDRKSHYGFLAQDLQQVYPDLVYAGADGVLGVDYQGLIPIIIEQLKSMNKSINDKDSQIKDLMKRLKILESKKP